MATSLRLPPELEADIEQLAKEHNRSAHGEMLHALRAYVGWEKRPVSENEADSLMMSEAGKEARSAAVAKSNKVNPRRKRKEEDNE